jgi:peptidoglycan hydrolase CwlO-like protein
MSRSKLGLVCALVTVVGIGFVGNALSQDTTTRPAGDREARRAEFQKRMADQMKETLGVTDDEWKALQPKIEKVQSLQRDLMSAAMRGMGRAMFGNRGRGGDNPTPAPAADDSQQSDLQKKASALHKLLADKNSKPEDVKTALADYRAARDKVREDITKAQKDLKEIVTVQQEAQLVGMGVLE